jgi:hypothetical protein
MEGMPAGFGGSGFVGFVVNKGAGGVIMMV